MNIESVRRQSRSKRVRALVVAGLVAPAAVTALVATSANATQPAGSTEHGSAVLNTSVPSGTPSSVTVSAQLIPATSASGLRPVKLAAGTGVQTFTSNAKVVGPLPKGVPTSGTVTATAQAGPAH